ncbi:MAG: DUF559 domain-containing protein [Clostridia bacterium]|nr:DUF559 domain-containing protein [Clostridia bacterium]MBQ8383342.1 DUF559 domain-containing protein [Clostridia bacterium]
MLKYNKSNIELARALRKQMTPWERKLWYEFLRTYPIRFQRQKAIDNYIADFYCAKARLVIELDGKWHYTAGQSRLDVQRTAELKKMNLRVLRIANHEIDIDFRGVCLKIDAIVQNAIE